MSHKKYKFYCGGEMYNTIRQGYQKKSVILTGTDVQTEIITQPLDDTKLMGFLIGTLPEEHQNKYRYVFDLEHSTFTFSDNVEYPIRIVRTINGQQLWAILTNLNYPVPEEAPTVTYSIPMTYYTDNHGIFAPQSDTESLEALDQLANNYVKNMETLTVAYSYADHGTITATFTPLTDEVLLDAVNDGKVTIRLQLMQHQSSYSPKHNKFLSPIIFNEGSPTWRSEEEPHDICYVRTKSHSQSFKNITWCNLTVSELQNGSAILLGVDRLDKHICDEQDEQQAKVEIFCAALKRKGKDPFFYERGGYRKISSNYIRFQKEY